MTTPPQPAPKSGGNVFTRHVGPLPMWAWMGIALVLALGYYLIKKKGSSSTSSGGTSPSTVDTPGGEDSSLVPQFVNQTYVQGAPPAAPASSGSTATASPLNEVLQAGHIINPSAGNAEVGWTIAQKSPNATQLKVTINGPGKKNQTRYVPATATTATFQDLSPGHTYDVSVTPIDAQGQAVGGPNNINLVTAKK
jgi:hypothetical protein